MIALVTIVALVVVTKRGVVHRPTLATKPPWVLRMRPALIGLGLRGRALERLETCALFKPPPDPSARLTMALSQLERRDVGPSDVAAMLTRQPKLLPALLEGEPGETLEALAELGLDQPLPLLLQQPLLLGLGPDRVRRAAAYLESYVGEGRVAEFARLHPQSLLWVPDEETPAAQHLRMLGLPDALVRRAGDKCPWLYKLASSDNLEQTIAFLRGDEVGLGDAALHRLIGRFPELLGLSFAANVRPKVAFLRECGADPTRVISQHPQVLGYALDDNLRPKVAYLRALGVDVARALERHPALLGLGLESTLRPTVGFLQREVRLAHLGRALTAQPVLLSLSVEGNLRPKLEWLRSLRMPGLAAQLDAYPALLTLSLASNLQPSEAALREAGLLDAAPLPLRARHLAASLDGRIRPRLAFVRALHSARVRRNVSLHAVCTASDDAFCRLLGTPPEAFRDYKARAAAAAAPSRLSISWLPPRRLKRPSYSRSGGTGPHFWLSFPKGRPWLWAAQHSPEAPPGQMARSQRLRCRLVGPGKGCFAPVFLFDPGKVADGDAFRA